MNVVLPPDLERYVESLVQKGDYAASSEVITEALRQHQVNRPAFQVVMTPELERMLDEGMREIDQALTTEQLRQRR
jgi:putative addiction module CopG family antidote